MKRELNRLYQAIRVLLFFLNLTAVVAFFCGTITFIVACATKDYNIAIFSVLCVFLAFFNYQICKMVVRDITEIDE